MKKIYLFISVCFFSLIAQASIVREDPDSLILAAVSSIKADSLYTYVEDLQNMGTRFMIAPNSKEVATWIMNKFISLGVSDVRLDSFPAHVSYFPYDTTTWQYNVEASIQGTEYPEKEIVILAHYDNYAQGGDPLISSPGADDNASGTAALFECARVIQTLNYQPRQTIIFLASAAEELMYFGDSGTEHYAPEAQAAGRDIVMVMNNDMIGYDDGSWTIDLINHSGSPEATALAIDIISTYTTLNYVSQAPVPVVGADIEPFLSAGYKGVYFMEHEFNPYYHSIDDVIGQMDFNYLAEVTAINMGCILQTEYSVSAKNYPVPKAQLKIFPNPASGNVTIVNPDNKPQVLKIYKPDGTYLLSHILSDKTAKIDISNLIPGVYLLMTSSETKSYYGKLVVAP